MTSVAAVFWASLPFVLIAFTAGMWIGAELHVCEPQTKGIGDIERGGER